MAKKNNSQNDASNYKFKNGTVEETAKFFERVNAGRAKQNPALPKIAAEPKNIGGSGVPLGGTVYLTGVLDLAVPVKDAKGVVVATYIGCETSSGKYVSLNSIIGLKNDKGYSTGKFDHYLKVNNKKVNKPVECKTTPDFDFLSYYKSKEELFQFEDFYECAFAIEKNPDLIKGNWTNCGELGKSYVAKSKPNGGFEDYDAGYERVLIGKVWMKG